MIKIDSDPEDLGRTFKYNLVFNSKFETRCPQYKIWQEVFKLLKNTQSLIGHGGDKKPVESYIIYQNWEHVIPIELKFQFKRYIEWASDQHQLEETGKYLRSLSESDWVHFGEA